MTEAETQSSLHCPCGLATLDEGLSLQVVLLDLVYLGEPLFHTVSDSPLSGHLSLLICGLMKLRFAT
jgi:hypothetical protein